MIHIIYPPARQNAKGSAMDHEDVEVHGQAVG